MREEGRIQVVEALPSRLVHLPEPPAAGDLSAGHPLARGDGEERLRRLASRRAPGIRGQGLREKRGAARLVG